jgi:ADP-ribose pyrophosphatase YjhB (NUDIX family)
MTDVDPIAPPLPPRPLATVGALVVGPSGRILLIRTHKWRDSWGVPGAHFILINFLARSDGERVILNDEAQEARWLDAHRALELKLNSPTRALVAFYLEHGFSTEVVT